MKHRYTKQQIESLVKTGVSYAQVLKSVGIVPAGGNYATLKKFIESHNISTDHFRGQGWNSGNTNDFQKKPITDYLTNVRSIGSSALRKRLISEGLLPAKCSSCSLEHWLSKPIPLELDHIDGNHRNNELSNLRLLCPNCHAQTPTYRRSKSSIR